MYTPEELHEAGLDDFRVFLIELWAYLSLPQPTRVQRDIAKWLQHGPRRLILEAFRGVGKSWITVGFVLWTLLLDPQKKIMVVSASQGLADDFSKFCKQIIMGWPLLQHLAPRMDQRNSAISFDVGPATPSKDPSVKSVGITGQLTGSRADIIVADDIEIPKNSFSHLMRERLAELVKEFDAVLKPGGRVLYLGTPQVEQSLYNRLPSRGYEVRVWPAEIPACTNFYGGRLAPLVERLIAAGAAIGAPVDPERFNEFDLMERRQSYGSTGYALQFMLDTTPSDADAHPLKCRDLIVHDCDSEMAHVRLVWGGANDLVLQDLQAGGFDGDVYHRAAWKSDEMTPYAGAVMAIDPSGRGKDETAYAILKYAHGLLYLVDSGGFLDGFGDATLSSLAAKCARWHVRDVVIERNYGGGMFDSLLKPHLARVGHGIIDEEWNGWSSTMKENRILDVLQPVLEGHRLVVARRVIENDIRQQQDDAQYSLIQQMTRMARIKGALPHEDRLEALSMAVSYYTDRMARDQDKALADHKLKLLNAELKNHIKNAFGVPGRPGTPGFRPARRWR